MLDPVRRALLMLAICSFGLGTGEYVALGLLPDIATDLGVEIARAGNLVSAYAAGVVIGAPLLTAASVRLPRKGVVIGLVIGLALGNVASALTPGFTALLVMRFLAGLPHGAFFGVASVQAANLVPHNRRSQAMAVVFAGLTVANIVGVPLTTYVGQNTSWRLVFVLIAAVEVIGVLGVWATVPRTGVTDGSASSLRNELSVFRNRPIWIALTVATVGCGAIFSTFSYISPMMTEVAGYAESSITWLLILFGLGMTVGNLLGARVADRYELTTVIYCLMAAQALTAGAFYLVAGSRIWSAVMIFVFPCVSTMAFPALQNRIIGLAEGAPNLAAAATHAAFNIANSAGAWLGGLTIAAGMSYRSPNLVAVGLGLAAAVIALTAQLAKGPVYRTTELPTPGPEPIRLPSTVRGPGDSPYPPPVTTLRPALTPRPRATAFARAGDAGRGAAAARRAGASSARTGVEAPERTATTAAGITGPATAVLTAPLLAALQQVTVRPSPTGPQRTRRTGDSDGAAPQRPDRAPSRISRTDRGTGPGSRTAPQQTGPIATVFGQGGTATATRSAFVFAPDTAQTAAGSATAGATGARPGRQSTGLDDTNPIPAVDEAAPNAADTNPIPIVRPAPAVPPRPGTPQRPGRF